MTSRLTLKHATPSQQRVYVFILGYKIRNGGNSPSYRDISRGCLMSTSAVYQAVQRLIKNGKLSLDENRRIRVCGEKWLPPKKLTSA
jgi:hypothetical protein